MTPMMETVTISECPEGCQGFELEAEGRYGSVDELVETAREAFPMCGKCGADLAFVRRDEPSQVLD